MNYYTEKDTDYIDTHIEINIFSHILVPYIREDMEMDSKMPPPFDVWGQAKWKVVQCNNEHSNSCLEYCVQEGKRKEDLKLSVLKNFNTIFGVTRNKQFANAFRAKKAQALEEKEEEEFEEEEEEEEEDYSSSSAEEEPEEEEEEEVEDEEEEDEEEEEEEEDDVEESSITSSSSSEIIKRKRK